MDADESPDPREDISGEEDILDYEGGDPRLGRKMSTSYQKIDGPAVPDHQLPLFRRQEYRPLFISGLILILAIVICVIFALVVLDQGECKNEIEPLDAGSENQNNYYYEDEPLHPFQVRDLVRADRISGLTMSPDGKTAAFIRRVWSTKANVSSYTLWATSIENPEPHRVTPFEWGTSDSSPVWMSDKTLYLLSDRSGMSQIYQVNIDGTDFKRISNFPVSLTELMVDPTRQWLAFSAKIVPGRSMEESAQMIKEFQQGRVPDYGKLTGVRYDKTFVRHWDTWRNHLRSHVFLSYLGEGEKPKGEEVVPSIHSAVDVMYYWDVDAPTQPFGGKGEWSFSSNGQYFTFTRLSSCAAMDNQLGCEKSEKSSVTWTDNSILCTVELTEQALVPICFASPAIDTQPRFHPEKSEIMAFIRTDTLGYESAQRLLYQTNITEALEQASHSSVLPPLPTSPLFTQWENSIDEAIWGKTGEDMYITSVQTGYSRLFKITVNNKKIEPWGPQENIQELGLTEVEGVEGVVAMGSSMYKPADVYYLDGASPSAYTQITSFNNNLLESVEMGITTSVYFSGANGDKIEALVVLPLNYSTNSEETFPLAMLIHGGPQSSWTDSWSYRWNPQIWAANGYFVVMINFHGSTGYGQNFTDSITGDWGGKPYNDILLGLDYFLSASQWSSNLDASRVVGLGASYGGYMINWLNGHTTKFQALVNHDGIFDVRAMYYDTEELWFPEHDMEGPQYEVPENYEKWNPALHVKNWVTPTLVIQGGRDYRLPTTHGLSTFTALQRQGIPSRFLYFEKENHWILNPVNLCFWYDNVLSFIGEYADNPYSHFPPTF